MQFFELGSALLCSPAPELAMEIAEIMVVTVAGCQQ